MADRQTTVDAAIHRWLSKGLVDSDLAARLLAESAEAYARKRRRLGQYAVAGTGAVVLVTAAILFFAWTWPSLGAAARTFLIAVVGVLVQGLGLAMESRQRWVPVSYALQTAGLALLLAAFAYSEEAWADRSPGGIVAGLLSLAVPIVMAPVFIRRNPVMPAIATALGYLFLYLFLDRSMGLQEDTIIWILDLVLLGSVLLLVVRLRRHAVVSATGWYMNAFVASLYAGFFLVLATGVGPLSLDQDTVWGLDMWLALVTGLTLWGIHRAPPPLQRGWYKTQLSLSMGIGIVLSFWTLDGAVNAPAAGTALTVAGLGGVGLWYALRQGVDSLIVASCVALLAAAWFLAISESGALGAALALGFTAILFFWVAGRIGRERETGTAYAAAIGDPDPGGDARATTAPGSGPASGPAPGEP